VREAAIRSLNVIYLGAPFLRRFAVASYEIHSSTILWIEISVFFAFTFSRFFRFWLRLCHLFLF